MGKIKQAKEKKLRNEVHAKKYEDSNNKDARKKARKIRLATKYALMEAKFYSQTLTGPPIREPGSKVFR
jgi:hypothetical protein